MSIGKDSATENGTMITTNLLPKRNESVEEAKCVMLKTTPEEHHRLIEEIKTRLNRIKDDTTSVS